MAITDDLNRHQSGDLDPEEAKRILREWLRADSPMDDPYDDIVTWAEDRFWVADQLDPDAMKPTDNAGPVILMPHQKTLLRYMFDPLRPIEDTYQTQVWSTIKKSGKTAVASMVSRWKAETSGKYADVILVGNDVDQARSRIYDAAIHSMEMDPLFDRQRRELLNANGTTEWRIIRSLATYIPNDARIRPIALDYRGEAGANPSATVFTELWGADQERARRLYDEMVPPPTKPRAIRFVEGYAGYEGESILWREIWDMAQKDGRRLTREELAPYGEWPFEDDPPIWINPQARMCAYIDQGIEARRMPWQQGELGRRYYETQERTERPDAFARLHLNLWVSSVTEFIPIAWWEACREENLAPLPRDWPIIVGADAAVTGDCAAIVGVCRDPTRLERLRVLFTRIWTPTPGHPLDFAGPGGFEDEIRRMCAQYNVAQVAYDPYQLHRTMTGFMQEGLVWCRAFNQVAERARADKQLYDIIRDRRIVHPGLPDLSEHIKNAAAKHAPDEDTRLRIIKKSQSGKIDSAVALSMACAEALRLNLV